MCNDVAVGVDDFTSIDDSTCTNDGIIAVAEHMTIGPRPAFAAGQEEEWQRVHRRIFRFCKSFPLTLGAYGVPCDVLLYGSELGKPIGTPPPSTNEGAFP